MQLDLLESNSQRHGSDGHHQYFMMQSLMQIEHVEPHSALFKQYHIPLILPHHLLIKYTYWSHSNNSTTVPYYHPTDQDGSDEQEGPGRLGRGGSAAGVGSVGGDHLRSSGFVHRAVRLVRDREGPAHHELLQRRASPE
jgi:hypothetical protein